MRSKRHLVATLGLSVFVLVLLQGSARPALAQVTAPPYLAILDAISALGRTVGEALGNIQASLDALTTTEQVNVRTSAPIDTPAGGGPLVTCSVVNVSDSTRRITLLLLGATLSVRASDTIDLQAGRSHAVSIASTGGRLHCRFTVEDGTRADIRAALTVVTSLGTPLGVVMAE